MIVAVQFGLELFDPGADAGGFGEIQRCPFDAGDFTRGNQFVVRRSVAAGGQPQFVVEHISGSGEIEVNVTCQIDRRGLVGCSPVINPEFVAIRKRVSHRDREIPRITFLSIPAQIAELDTRLCWPGNRGFASQTTWANPLRPP